MSRLTEFRKDLNRYEYKQDERGYCWISEGQIVNKLGKLEDLEEQLGNNFSGKNNECSFNMLFMATQNGFWYQVERNKFIHLVPDDSHSIIYDWNGGYPILQYMEVTKDFAYTIQCVYDVYLTDYKKKFWLKEDKSE